MQGTGRPPGGQSGKGPSKRAQGAALHSLKAAQRAWGLGCSGPCWGEFCCGSLGPRTLVLQPRGEGLGAVSGRREVPASPLVTHSCPRLLSRTGLKVDWVWAEVRRPPLLPTRVSPACPGGPCSRPLVRLWTGLAQASCGTSCPVRDGCQDGCEPGWASVSDHLPGSCRNFP